MVLFLLSAILLNAVLFYSDQKNKFDLYSDQLDVSIKEFYGEYNELLQEFSGLSYEEMVSKLGEWYTSKESTLTPKEDKMYWMLESTISYGKEYPSYLSQIQTRAEEMNTISIFSKPDSYSSKNIEKTASDYKSLEGITLKMGNGDAVTGFISFQLADYIVLLLIMTVAYQLLAERKKGLWDIVHSTKNGRLYLAIKRCLLLFGTAVLLCSLIYGVNLLLSFHIYGGEEIVNSSLQSIPTFQYCDLKITVLEFLCAFLLVKVGSVFLIGLIIWFILSAIGSLSIGMLSLGLFLAIEYSLFYFLPVQSILNVLKYVNIFSYIDLQQIFVTYLNVNIFSQPIGARTIIIGMLPCFILLFSGACIVVNARKKPKESSSILNKLSELLQGISNFILSHLRVWQLELYKILFVKKGILILLLFLVYQHNAIASGEVFLGREELYFSAYVERIAGPLGAETYQKMSEVKGMIEAEEAKSLELQQQVEQGIITEEEYTMQFSYYGLDALVYKQTAYERLEQKVERVEETSEQVGTTVWVIPEYGYDYLLGKNSYQKHNISALLVMFIVVMMLSTVFVYEKQNQTALLLRSMRQGREYLYRKKELAGICIIVCVFLIGNSTMLITTSNLYGLQNLNAPLQSLDMFKEFPVVMSIGQFLLLLYSIRLVMLLCCMYIVYLISMLMNKEEHAILMNLVIVMIPSVMYTIGIDGFKFIAISNQISAISSMMEVIQNTWAVVPMLGLLVLAVCLRRVGNKIWANK